MILRNYSTLPHEFQNDSVKKYYSILEKRKASLVIKRIFDFCVSLVMVILLLPVFAVLAVAIKIDSPGGVFFRQERITTYGKAFRIYKFRNFLLYV